MAIDFALFKRKVLGAVAMFYGLAAVAPLFIAAAVVFLQCLGWLKQAIWQPVPFGLLFLSPAGQNEFVRLSIPIHPIGVVPSLGDSLNMQQAAWALAGGRAG